MANKEQLQRLRGFSRMGFLFPQIYLLWARQYVFVIAIIIISFVLGYFSPNVLFSLVLFLIFATVVGVKGRALAFHTTKKTFKDFQSGYKYISKIVIIVGLCLFGIIIIGKLSSALITKLSIARDKAIMSQDVDISVVK